MKGKILGFDAAAGTGVINGEDGSRYRFASNDWRSERTPAAGASVDFEAAGDRASEIYPVGMQIGGLSPDALAGPGMDKATALLRESLATPLAIVVLLAMFLPAIGSPMMTVSTMGLGNLPNFASAAFLADEHVSSSLSTAQSLMFLRFAAPIAALWAIWSAWSDKPLKLPMLVTGTSALIAAGLSFALRSAVVSAMGVMGEAAGRMISVGFGAWLLALAGVALLLAGIGIIRNPLAGK